MATKAFDHGKGVWMHPIWGPKARQPQRLMCLQEPKTRQPWWLTRSSTRKTRQPRGLMRFSAAESASTSRVDAFSDRLNASTPKIWPQFQLKSVSTARVDAFFGSNKPLNFNGCCVLDPDRALTAIVTPILIPKTGHRVSLNEKLQ